MLLNRNYDFYKRETEGERDKETERHQQIRIENLDDTMLGMKTKQQAGKHRENQTGPKEWGKLN